MTRDTSVIGRVAVTLAAALALGGAASVRAQEDGFFPNTKTHGQASIRYNDGRIDFVANYVYSQLNHDSRWLYIESGLTTKDRMIIHRDDITLITPSGREIPLASQRRFREDSDQTQLLLQNATTSTRPIANYFTRRTFTENMRFFVMPGGGTVQSEFVIDDNTVAFGALFFEAPTGLWEDGVYSLVVKGKDDIKATVPIELL